jgi:hypothetical protein
MMRWKSHICRAAFATLKNAAALPMPISEKYCRIVKMRASRMVWVFRHHDDTALSQLASHLPTPTPQGLAARVMTGGE